MKLQLVPIVIGLMVVETAGATAQDVVRTFSVDSIRERCITFSEVSRGSGTEGYRDCRVSRFGELGTVDGETYYYAIYCLIPAASPGVWPDLHTLRAEAGLYREGDGNCCPTG